MNNFKHLFFDEVYYYEKIISSSKKAEKMIKDNQVRGNFLILAEAQTGGIGRFRNRWFSPVGGLWFTAALYKLPISSPLTIFWGICLHKTLLQLFPKLQGEIKLKWPNDIYLAGRKLSGILTIYLDLEKYHLIGIGINSNVCEWPQDIGEKAISLKNFLGCDVDNMLILKQLFDIFSRDLPNFIESGFDLKYANDNCLLLNKNVILDTDFDQYEGRCLGINKNGAVLLELKSGMIQPFLAGSIVSWK
jgi:birA, biotin-[acetyl-CoA-carboxylase] ligase region